MATQNYFDAFMENQKKLVESMTEASKKMQESMAESMSPKSSAPDVITDYFEKQKELVNEMSALGPGKESMEKAPDIFKKWLEVQTEFGNKWVDSFQQTMTKDNPMGSFFKPVQDTYQQWEQWMQRTMSGMQSNLGMQFTPVYGKMPSFMDFTKGYTGMQGYFDQITEVIKNGMFSADAMNKFMPQDSYKEIINNLMGFQSNDAIKQGAEYMNKMFGEFAGQLKEASEKGMGSMSSFTEPVKNMGANNWTSMVGLSSQLFDQMERAYSPFNNFAPNRSQAIAEELQSVQRDFTNYMVKSMELQNQVYEGAQKGLEETIAGFWESYQREGTLPDYDQFMKRWIDMLEENITKVFQTEAYSKNQSEVAETSLKIRKTIGKILEETTQDLPFTMRSESDELAAEVHSLRNKIRNLEKKLEEKEKPAAKATKTTTARKTRSTSAKTKKANA